jgi:probable addiction module antidote protein
LNKWKTVAKQAKAFDAAAYLDTPEAMAEYMAAAMETGDAGLIKESVGDIIRAKGMTAMAKASGVSRASLYRAFGEGGNPTLDNMMAVINALGLTLSAKTPTKVEAKRKAAAKTPPTKKKAARKASAKPAPKREAKSASSSIAAA